MWEGETARNEIRVDSLLDSQFSDTNCLFNSFPTSIPIAVFMCAPVKLAAS